MKLRTRAPLWLAPLLSLTVGCGGDDSSPDPIDDARVTPDEQRDGSTDQGGDAGQSSDAGSPDAAGSAGATIATRLTTAQPDPSSNKLRAGAASLAGLKSLKYLVRSIQICESLEAQGSAFHNPAGCLELYNGDQTLFPYMTSDDFTPLAEAARKHGDEGFVDLLDPGSRKRLASATTLTKEHVRAYNFGIITWALPIKLTATVSMSDGSSLYTHDGVTSYAELGADRYRDYFTEASASLTQGPAEEAVVLLPNGGNWFKFQSPLVISSADIEAQQSFVLDLVFNPDGIIKGFSEGYPYGSLRNSAPTPHGISVPMLDLSPVPHRASENVVRESYRGALRVDGNAFDVRLELYSVEGDSTGTIFGVDVKSLVNAETNSVPPSLAKVAFVERAADGTLSFLSGTRAPLITGLRQQTTLAASTSASIRCGTHADREAAEGGAALIVNSCPSASLELSLTLEARTTLPASP